MNKLVSLVSAALLLSCSDSQFSGSPNTSPPASAEATPEPPVKTLELKSASKTAPIDMVWVVDNSGSMKEEVSQVRTNIQSFTEAVGKELDLRLSFISNDSPDFGLTFDNVMTVKDFQQVNQTVGSYNLMTMLTSALCEKGTTEGDRLLTKICGETVDPPMQMGRNNDAAPDVVRASGALKDRMRADAFRVYVFVTDDDAQGTVRAENFMKVSASDPMRSRAFAFAGLAKTPGCEIANIGTQYVALANDTGGEVFDICAVDWSENFSKLTENVLKIAQNVFDLPSAVGKIVSVSIQGKVLDKKQYSVMGGKLYIDEALLKAGDTVVFSYQAL